MPKLKQRPATRQPDDEKESAGFLRLKIPMKNGVPDLSDWDARDSTKAKYRNLIQSPAFQKKIGLGESSEGLDASPAAERPSVERDDVRTEEAGGKGTERSVASSTAAGNSVEQLHPSDVEWLFDVYAAIFALIACSVLKADFDVIHPVVKFDDEQKKSMAAPLATCIMKYVPVEYLFYIPEFRLITMLATITGTNFNRAREAALKSKPPTEKPAPAGTSHTVVPMKAESK